MHLLLIEDDHSDSMYIEEILCDHKIDVRSSLPPENFNLSNYDFVICDYFVGGKTSLEYFEKLLNVKSETPPFILISGKLDEVPIEKIPKSINSYIVSKNLHFKEMLNYYVALISEMKNSNNKKVDYKTLFFELVHDLRNDLSLSANFKDVGPLLETVEEEIEFLRSIKDSSVYAYNRVSTLSDFVQSETPIMGTIVQAIDSLRGSPLLDEVISKTEIESGADVIINVMPLYFVSVVLKNLLENSFKYASKKSQLQVKVNVKVEKGTLIVLVQDNGDGMPSEKAASLFLKKQSSQDGLGIGLVILNRIVEIYKGNIIVKSDVGVGTKIQLSFEYHK